MLAPHPEQYAASLGLYLIPSDGSDAYAGERGRVYYDAHALPDMQAAQILVGCVRSWGGTYSDALALCAQYQVLTQYATVAWCACVHVDAHVARV